MIMKIFKTLSVILMIMMFMSGCAKNDYEGTELEEVSGKKFVIDELELEVKSVDIRNEVKPNNPQGYYPHYKEQEGYHYIVLNGTLKNLSDKVYQMDRLRVTGEADEEMTQAKLVLINEIESYFWGEIGPGVSLDFYLFAIVDEDTDKIDNFYFYYDDDHKIDKEQKEFDYKVKYVVPEGLESNE